MLRYADAIVKRGVDKLIDAIGHSPEPQTKNAETPQPQKRMGNDTDCAPQTTGNTTNCGLTEQAVSLMVELYDMHYNVPDRTPEVQRRDQANKGFVPVSKLVRNTCGMGQKFTAVVLGRELVQLQVPRRRSSKATLYYVGRKHDEGGLKNRLFSETAWSDFIHGCSCSVKRNQANGLKHQTLPLMGATRPASGTKAKAHQACN